MNVIVKMGGVVTLPDEVVDELDLEPLQLVFVLELPKASGLGVRARREALGPLVVVRGHGCSLPVHSSTVSNAAT